MSNFTYLDHAATTYVKDDVLKVMNPYISENFANPSSNHLLGKNGFAAIEKARKNVAVALNCQADEVFFTSGGTESDNWAIIGIAFANKSKGNHIITSAIEHPAVTKSIEYLERNGFDITYLPVDEYGLVSLDQLKTALKKNTILVSIMFANNEVGTIQPIKEIGEITKQNNVYFHTDAVQAIGNIKIDVNQLNIDLLSLSSHKFNGPKGTGALFIREGVNIDPFVHGGSQERGRRAGTENVPGIVGLGKAIELATSDIEVKNRKIMTLRDTFIRKVLNNIPGTELNGHPTERLPGNANISFNPIDARYLASFLDNNNIYVSTGSACSCKSNSISRVLLAMNKAENVAFSSVRFTFGEDNTADEIEYTVNILSDEVNRIRCLK